MQYKPKKTAMWKMQSLERTLSLAWLAFFSCFRPTHFDFEFLKKYQLVV
jgi:hypothetical protein